MRSRTARLGAPPVRQTSRQGWQGDYWEKRNHRSSGRTVASNAEVGDTIEGRREAAAPYCSEFPEPLRNNAASASLKRVRSERTTKRIRIAITQSASTTITEAR